MMIEKPNISPDFSIEDIHKIREYNYELTKNMSAKERRVFYRKNAEEATRRIDAIKKSNKTRAV